MRTRTRGRPRVREPRWHERTKVGGELFEKKRKKFAHRPSSAIEDCGPAAQPRTAISGAPTLGRFIQRLIPTVVGCF